MGTDNGGHDHNHDSRPLGLVVPSQGTRPIPIDGLNIEYESPEIAGDVELELEAKDPMGQPILLSPTTFKVQIDQPMFDLNMSGLTVNAESHPHEGQYGRSILKTVLSKLVTRYYSRTNTISQLFGQPMAPVTSEGSSLRKGGLFDFDWEHKPWQPGHCGHRDGLTIDLSVSQFVGLKGIAERRILEGAAARAGLKFNYAAESPRHPKRHWHATTY